MLDLVGNHIVSHEAAHYVCILFSFRDLRAALLDDTNRQYESLPYQAQDKYIKPGYFLKASFNQKIRKLLSV